MSRISTEAEDDARRQAHVVLQRGISGGVILEPGHEVFGLNEAESEMTLETNVQAAASGHGKRVLGGEERTVRRAFGNYDLTGVRTSKQSLDKGSDSAAVPEGKAWAEEIGDNTPVCVVHVDCSLIRARESNLRVREVANVGYKPKMAVQIESDGCAGAIHPYQPVTVSRFRNRLQIRIAQKQIHLGSAVVTARMQRGCLGLSGGIARMEQKRWH
jgi:hypothetical protein